MRTLSTFTGAVLAAAIVLSGSAFGQVVDTLIDFEAPGFDPNSGTAVGDAGFDFFFSSSGGVAPDFGDFSGFIENAPGLNINDPTIVTVASGGDALNGDQSLVFFTDVFSGLFQDDPTVNNDPRVLNLSVFQQQSITAADIGSTVTYDFIYSGGTGAVNTDPSTTVEAFLLTLDPNNNFATTNNLGFDLSGGSVGTTQTGSLTLDLTNPALAGQTLQFGFRNSAADGQNPAVILDNLSLTVTAAIPEPSSLVLLGVAGLGLVARRRRV